MGAIQTTVNIRVTSGPLRVNLGILKFPIYILPTRTPLIIAWEIMLDLL